MMKLKYTLLLSALVIAGLGSAKCQIFDGEGVVLLQSSSGSYTENFDDMGATGSWNDNLEGWYANDTSSSGSTGLSSATGTYTYQDEYVGSTPTDLSLGLSNSTDGATVFVGLMFQNDSGEAINFTNLAYRMEQYHSGSTNSQSVSFSYAIGDSSFTDFTTGTYIEVPALDMISVNNTGAGRLGSSDPDAPLATSNTANISSALDITLLDGQYLFLRWEDTYEGSTGHGMGIDDLSLTYVTGVPEPSSMLLGSLVLGVYALRRRRR